MATNEISLGPAGLRFGQLMRELRVLAGLGQQELAAKLRDLGHPLPVSSISRLENGERRADISDLVAIAVALDVAPARLLLPGAAPDTDWQAEIQLTEALSVSWERAWRWATGEESLNSPTLRLPDMSRAEVAAVLEARGEWNRQNSPAYHESHEISPEGFRDLTFRLEGLLQPVREAKQQQVTDLEIMTFIKFVLLASSPRAEERGDPFGSR